MANQVLSNLTRTLSTYFRFGTLRLKDSSGVMEVRNAADSANADLAANKLRVKGSNAANAVILDAPGSLGANLTLVLPGSDGASGEYLKTNGSGTLSWGTPGSNSDMTQVESFTEATSSPLTIFAPAANTVIRQITIEVTVAASGGSPTVQVGYAADPDAYLLTTESDLKEVGCYSVYPMSVLGASPADVLLTITPSGQTFQGKVYIVHTVPN